MIEILAVFAPLVIGALLIVIINQRQQIKTLALRERLALSKYQLLSASLIDR